MRGACRERGGIAPKKKLAKKMEKQRDEVSEEKIAERLQVNRTFEGKRRQLRRKEAERVGTMGDPISI